MRERGIYVPQLAKVAKASIETVKSWLRPIGPNSRVTSPHGLLDLVENAQEERPTTKPHARNMNYVYFFEGQEYTRYEVYLARIIEQQNKRIKLLESEIERLSGEEN